MVYQNDFQGEKIIPHRIFSRLKDHDEAETKSNTSHIYDIYIRIFLFFQNPVQGATTAVYTAVSKDIEDKGGIYLSNCRDTHVNPLVKDQAICDRLHKLSLEQAQLKDFLEYL